MPYYIIDWRSNRMIILLAVALSIDALGIGVSYSLRGIQIPIGAKIIIAMLSVLFTFIAVLLGKSIVYMFPPYISKFIGIAILLFMGLWIISQGIKKDEKKETEILKEDTIINIIIKSLGITIKVIRNPLSCDFDKSAKIDPFEAIYMGIALSIDSIGVGIGSAIAGVNSLIIPFTVGFFQLLFLYLGDFIGKKLLMFEKIDSRIWVVLSGVLLIIIAIIRCFS